MFYKNRIPLITAIIFTMILSACGGNTKEEKTNTQEESASDKPVITMGQISWAENVAVTNMWKVILENKGYQVEFNLLDMGVQMSALSKGELDVNLEIWLPVQDANYLEKYKEEVNFSEETWYDNAKVGLVVPSYMEDVNSIEDLNDQKEALNGEITGFDSGAGTMMVTKDVIKKYNLDYELVPSSEPAMLTEIEEAMEDEEPIVAPLWSPHRIFSQLDLKYLKDSKKVYGGVEKIHHATRHGFAEDYPEVSKWFKNWKMDDQAIGELMTYVAEAEAKDKDPIVGAEKWVEENQQLVNEWTK
ncbi:glycine betaine/proline transport system substrate-binding protein [Salinibacillus kushneri]|uniref:Glycine betaine/proline transport system substrate-binding protein n=1 Tax=Salinibacillus kushneri TaxID=237682 RepID=A0A1I0F592_9BACI|nr:glycine betaine ABC transporter substrate-binding protein [Salinibacillus kushneri]SET53009.1 glycine betaine/proline transport system substrate-binding protein [Salinibacillus kushneri]